VREVVTPSDAEEIVAHLVDRVEQLPPPGRRFGTSVADRAKSILATIQRTGRVTTPQARSLDNMSLGVEKWFHDRELVS
jgi:hypothetical protein